MPRRTKRHISQAIAEWDEAHDPNNSDLLDESAPDCSMLSDTKEGLAIFEPCCDSDVGAICH